jgi:hypothetical protein
MAEWFQLAKHGTVAQCEKAARAAERAATGKLTAAQKLAPLASLEESAAAGELNTAGEKELAKLRLASWAQWRRQKGALDQQSRAERSDLAERLRAQLEAKPKLTAVEARALAEVRAEMVPVAASSSDPARVPWDYD